MINGIKLKIPGRQIIVESHENIEILRKQIDLIGKADSTVTKEIESKIRFIKFIVGKIDREDIYLLSVDDMLSLGYRI